MSPLARTPSTPGKKYVAHVETMLFPCVGLPYYLHQRAAYSGATAPYVNDRLGPYFAGCQPNRDQEYSHQRIYFLVHHPVSVSRRLCKAHR